MTALAGSGVAVTNPVASSAAAANPIRRFMVESSLWDSKKMQARPFAGKGAKGHQDIYSYTTAVLHRREAMQNPPRVELKPRQRVRCGSFATDPFSASG